MSAERRGDDSGAFSAAMQGVEPIEGGRRRSPGRSRRSRRVDRSTAVFEVEEVGSRVYGLRNGVVRARLEELRRGAHLPQNRLDLHGMTRDAARESVFHFIRQAARSGLRCVAITHGRGLRSPAGAVLKEAVRVWLTQLPLARPIQAFASAPPEAGGDGTTLLLLDAGRERPGNVSDGESRSAP